MEQKVLTYSDFSQGISKLAAQVLSSGMTVGSVHGVPRGGVPVAAALAMALQVPMVEEPGPKTLVVDDICDSGDTLNRFSLGQLTATLVLKDGAKHVPSFSAFNAKHGEWIVFPWERNEAPAEDAITRLVQVIGDDPTREGLLDTPRRVLKSYGELFRGYRMDPAEALKTQFSEPGSNEVVICKDIEMYSTCEHHMLPFFGRASVGYIPKEGRIVGLSKLARIVEVFSRRLQNQERITSQVANAIQEHLDPVAVGVVIEAEHFCMRARGVNKQNSKMVTSCMLGAFREKPEARSEFLRLIGR